MVWSPDRILPATAHSRECRTSFDVNMTFGTWLRNRATLQSEMNETLHPNRSGCAPGYREPGGDAPGPIAFQGRAAVSRPGFTVNRQRTTDFDRRLSGEKGPAAHLRLVVSRLPCACARVARSDQGTVETRQGAGSGHSRRAAS